MRKANTFGVMLASCALMGDSVNPFGMMFSSVRKIARGIITAWAGGLGNIPPGWALCDGTHGTPDLREKFVLAASPVFSVSDEGGSTLHQHSFTGDGHTHTIPMGLDVKIGIDFAPQTDSSVSTGSTANSLHQPPYYALAYIMYLG